MLISVIIFSIDEFLETQSVSFPSTHSKKSFCENSLCIFQPGERMEIVARNFKLPFFLLVSKQKSLYFMLVT